MIWFLKEHPLSTTLLHYMSFKEIHALTGLFNPHAASTNGLRDRCGGQTANVDIYTL